MRPRGRNGSARCHYKGEPRQCKSAGLGRPAEHPSNDIYKILLTYGGSGEESIVREIVGVFSVYGIDVNLRHLSLIADFMTAQAPTWL